MQDARVYPQGSICQPMPVKVEPGRVSRIDAAVTRRSATLLGAFSLVLLFLFSPQASHAAGPITVPSGFQDTLAIDGLTEPTQVRFAPDGHVFVAEKKGTVL